MAPKSSALNVFFSTWFIEHEASARWRKDEEEKWEKEPATR